MTKYAKAWEQEITLCLDHGNVTKEAFDQHLRHLSWLQHERLVHLLVMLFVAGTMMATFALLLFFKTILIMVLFMALLILVLFYVHHYYYLENTVQRWYKIADTLDLSIKSS